MASIKPKAIHLLFWNVQMMKNISANGNGIFLAANPKIQLFQNFGDFSMFIFGFLHTHTRARIKWFWFSGSVSSLCSSSSSSSLLMPLPQPSFRRQSDDTVEIIAFWIACDGSDRLRCVVCVCVFLKRNRLIRCDSWTSLANIFRQQNKTETQCVQAEKCKM